MTPGRAAAWVALMSLVLALGGCKLAAALSYKAFGPPEVPAKYVPDQQPMLVLVENYRRPSAAAPEAEHLSRFLMNELEEHEIAPVVELSALDRLRDARPSEYAGMKIPAIGRAVGAGQVLYVDLLEAGVERAPGGEMARGRVAARVRIVDTEKGQTLWPNDQAEGFSVFHETRYRLLRGDVTESTVRQEAYTAAADRIIGLFRKYRPDTLYEDDFEG